MEYELYHYGVKGQKWGHRRNQKKDSSPTPAGKKKKKSESVYQQERRRQKKHIATKRAIDVGSRFVNEYTKRHNVSINGMHVGVHDNAKLIVNTLLDYKYAKDTLR